MKAQMEKEQSLRLDGQARQENIKLHSSVDSAVMARIADLAKFEANNVRFESIDEMALNPAELSKMEQSLDNVKERDLVNKSGILQTISYFKTAQDSYQKNTQQMADKINRSRMNTRGLREIELNQARAIKKSVLRDAHFVDSQLNREYRI